MPKITTVYPRDRSAMAALTRCGYLERQHLYKCGLRDKRIAGYLKDGLIERGIFSRPGTQRQNREVFHLTARGRDFCRRQLSVQHIYSAQNPTHDLPIADRYFSLSQSERDSWKTESECRDIFSEHLQQLRDQGEEERADELWQQLQNGLISMPDSLYTSDSGVTIAFEVVTNHYGQAELESKEEAADALGATIDFERV